MKRSKIFPAGYFFKLLSNDSNRAVALFGFILIVLIWSGVLLKLDSECQMDIDAAFRQANNFARLLEENTLRVFKSADQVSLFLKYQYEKSGSNIYMSPYMETGEFQVSPFVLISICNENGDLLASNQVPFVFSNIKDREHFVIHANQDTKELVISKPVLGRSSGKWSIQVTRRLNKSDGSFGGVVVVSIDPFYFTKLFNQINLGGYSSVALIGKDGIVRAWLNGQQTVVGLNFNSSKVVQYARQNSAGQFTAKSIVDGETRLYSYRVLQDYPLITVVGISQNEALAGYYMRRNGYIMAAIYASLFIIASCIAFMVRLSAQKKAEELQLTLYRISDTANSSDNLNSLCHSVHMIVADIIAAENFAIILYDEEKKRLLYPYFADEFGHNASRMAAKGLPEYVIRTGKPLLVNPKVRKELEDKGELISNSLVLYWLGVPLKTANNKVFGVVSVFTYSQGQILTEDDKDTLSYISGQIAMVIERKRSEAELRKLSRIVEQSPVSVIITDSQGVIEYVNPVFTKITGYSADEAIGKKPNILKSGVHDSGFYANLWEEIIAGNIWQGDICNKRKDGSIYWERAKISPVRSVAGITTHFVGILEDITERKQLQDDLRVAKAGEYTINLAQNRLLAIVSKEIGVLVNEILESARLLRLNGTISAEQGLQVNHINDAVERLLNLLDGINESGTLQAQPIPAKLPEELIDRLKDAVTEGNYYLILEVIDRVAIHDAQLAAYMRSLTYRFEFQRLLNLVTKADAIDK